MNHDTSTIVDSIVRTLIEPLRILWWDGFRTGILVAAFFVILALLARKISR